jgi:hypothetical protein
MDNLILGGSGFAAKNQGVQLFSKNRTFIISNTI